jgi:L-glyceraldehyde 3-phosphate reductase
LVRLDQLARDRGETLSQLALTWLLSRPEMTSVIIGPRTIEQMRDCIGALDYPMLSHDEQAAIASILAR